VQPHAVLQMKRWSDHLFEREKCHCGILWERLLGGFVHSLGAAARPDVAGCGMSYQLAAAARRRACVQCEVL
jgi:hypothetical protein